MSASDMGVGLLRTTMGAPAKSRILVVEDDVETRRLVQETLSEDGFEVDAHGRAKGGESALRLGGISAVILDVWLPDANGIELCREWRKNGILLPILMLTARSDVTSRVAGLDAGADDYLGKPFALAELRARLRALLRRGHRQPVDRVFRRNDVVVDFQKRQAWVAGGEVPLTRREIDVLARLARGDGDAVAREDLLEDVWGESTAEATASLEVILARLRRKLERRGKGTLIRTIRGYGYALLGGDSGETR
jgi:two-component system, OmpR family, response regulator